MFRLVHLETAQFTSLVQGHEIKSVLWKGKNSLQKRQGRKKKREGKVCSKQDKEGKGKIEKEKGMG